MIRPASGGWWLSGGIAAANCIAAYQPKGAADYAASLVNLANPGTYNAEAGTDPDWDATNGWKFTKTSSHYLKTGVIPSSNTWTYMLRFSNSEISSNVLFGYRSGGGRVMIDQKNVWYNGGAGSYNVPTSGVIGMVGLDIYVNGTDVGNITNDTITSPLEIYIGCRNYSTALYSSFYLQAFCIYDTTITDTQAGLLTTAMAAL